MLSDLTPDDFHAMCMALRMAQAAGKVDAPGKISAADLAIWFDTTPQDIQATMATALEKLRNVDDLDCLRDLLAYYDHV